MVGELELDGFFVEYGGGGGVGGFLFVRDRVLSGCRSFVVKMGLFKVVEDIKRAQTKDSVFGFSKREGFF